MASSLVSEGIMHLDWRPKMRLRHPAVLAFAPLFLLGALTPAARPADKATPKKGGVVRGILMESGDKWVKVWGDREKDPITYPFRPGSEKKIQKGMKGTCRATRVQLTYQREGDKRQLVAIRSVMRRNRGVVMGVVVYNDGGWWVVLKFKNWLRDAYAVKDAAGKDQVKGLQTGDVVTLRYSTDSERHRIEAFRKTGTAKK
jgi:hypothetical protein